MKKYLIICLILIILIIPMLTVSCSNNPNAYTKYSYEFLGVFDTSIQFIGYSKSAKEFEDMAKIAQGRLMELHRLFDIYNNYEKLNNTKTINDNAGIKPVKVQREILDLVVFSKEWYHKTNQKCNIALGPVINIWHNYRETANQNPEKAKIPSMAELSEAMKYTDIENVIVDTLNSTVFLKEKNMRLDFGAVAKGYASEIVADELKGKGYTSFIISSGGNVTVVGKPLNSRNKWGVALQDPFINPGESNESLLDVLYVNDCSIVTSGDYQRNFTVGGKIYHHLIDPDTLMPANYFKSVSIIAEDSGVADFMSTTLFLIPYDKGRQLAEELGVGAVWVMQDGTMEATENAKVIMRDLGGAKN